MKIFGKPFGEYVAFARLFLILVPLAGLLRLGLSLQGVPNDEARWVSMTALGFAGIAYFAIRVHTTGFGSYKQLLVLVALQNISGQIISVLGILLAIITGTGNVFSSPEFSFNSQNQWLHLASHLFIGTTLGSLVPWAIGSLILLVTRRVSPSPQTA